MPPGRRGTEKIARPPCRRDSPRQSGGHPLNSRQIAADLHRQTGQYAEARRLALGSLAEAGEHGFAVLAYESVAIRETEESIIIMESMF